MAEDIRRTGPIGLRGIPGLNRQSDPLEQDMRDAVSRAGRRMQYSSAPETPVGNAALNAGYGASQYDDNIDSASLFEDIGDVRYNEQPWYDTLANGIGKMLGTAGTTFVSSLVGLPYGLGAAVNQGRWSALWDNDVTKGLADVDKWLEENMTNYKSQQQQDNPWYDPSNLFSMNFVADDIIKNAGFTLGAAASMAVGSGSLGLMSKALGLVNDVSKGTKMGQAALAALFSATGEGMIEARQGVEERNKLELQRLDDTFAPEMQALRMEEEQIRQEYEANRGRALVMGPDGRATDPAYEIYKQKIEDLSQRSNAIKERYNAGRQQIEESGQEMGNKILLANQALLTAGNLIQFGKGMVKSFDSARHAAEVSSKAAKPFAVTAKKVADGTYRVAGKNLGRTIAATKGLLTEGSEEMNQQWIQNSAGYSENEKDVNDYWRAKLDPEAYRDTTQGLYTIGNILDRGFQDSWGDADQWEQFVIGGLTGMAGTYSPTKIFNQDKTKGRLDPRRYGSWEGGIFNTIPEFNREYNQYEENIDDLNKILQSEDFPDRVRSMVGHTYTQGEKDAAVEGNDKKAWKDADDKQTIHDIQAFLRAGKLDDLRAIYDEMGSTLTDDDVQNIIKSTTKEISAEEDKQNHDRMIDGLISEEQIKVNALYDELESLQTGLLGSVPDAYDANNAYVQERTKDLLNQINSGERRIEDLNQQKQNYVGQKYYEGAYVDREGNQTASNEEIKNTVNHNSEELNRKLNSYLDSIDYVNKETKGSLTKDQEDNLAYLHHLGKESLVRADKIIADRRKELPQKFLMKTDKSPEQLTKEYDSSNLVFSKDENTKEGYVEVDTSLMDDKSFKNFFIGELLWGSNINPEFSESAEEKAIREEEEKDLPEEERKKKQRDRLSKKWKDSLEKQRKDAEEQKGVNLDLVTQNFIDNYRKNNNATQTEAHGALNELLSDIVDVSDLINQAGEYHKTLREYMANPSKVDEDKEKAEEEIQKQEDTKHAVSKFAGKDAKQMKQELSEGSLNAAEFDDFINADLSDVSDDDLKEAQQEAKKAQESNQKAAALKQHIQEQLGDNPTDEEIKEAQIAMQMVDNANLAADNPADISIDTPELNQVPIDSIDPTASIEDVDELNKNIQQKLADAFNAFQEDTDARNDIPETVPANAVNDVETPETSGKDPIVKIESETAAPEVSQPSEATQVIVPKNPLTENAIDAIITETSSATNPYNDSNVNGTWRSTTTRNVYGKSTGTYHEDKVTDKNSILYKRSKAIWEYLNREGAFERQANSSADRIKKGDAVHFMVMPFAQEIYGKDYRDLKEDEKPYALAIIMLNDNGEVIGDLPLAQFEPSYATDNQSRIKELITLQEKVFKAYDDYSSTNGSTPAIVDNILHKDGVGNLGLKFSVSKKPLMSKVKQVMRGAVPYIKYEKNTLNDVANGSPFELGVLVSDNIIAKKVKDKGQSRNIVIPKVGTIGQPYLLLPTPSGEQVAIPFYMAAFDAEKHSDTEFYKQLTNAVYSLITNNSQSTATQKEAFMKNLDVLKGLLQVKPQEGAKVIRVGSNDITLHLQSLTDDKQIYDITVPTASKDSAQVAKELVDGLSGISINVSLQYLNDTIQTGTRKADYNKVIGEIADVNLPKGTNHTVNGWFTVELAPPTGTKPSKNINTKTTGIITETVGGRSVQIDVDTLTAVDPTTGEVLDSNEEVAIRLAQIKANKPMYKDKDRIQISIDGELRTFDTKENKFVKNPPIQKETPVTPVAEKEELPSKSDVETPTNIVSIGDTQTEEEPAKQTKTLEQIESEMKQKKVVGRQTKDAWAAIPDSLKLKAVNDKQPIQLAYNEKVVVVSLSDRESFIKELSQANMAAKAGALKVSEAPKFRIADSEQQKRADIQREKRWLQQNLPMFSSENRLKFVQGLIKTPGNEGWAWGRFQSGVITLSDVAAAGTTYHEAFHAVTQTLLDDNDLKELYEAAKERYKEEDVAYLEELLAEDFRKYVQREETPIVGYIRKVFRKILNALRSFSNYNNAIDQLFYRINNGEFKNTLPSVTRGNNPLFSRYYRYEDRVNEDILHYNSSIAKAVVNSFHNNKSLLGSAVETGNNWTSFKKYWLNRGVVIKGMWRNKATGVQGYVLNDIALIDNGIEVPLDYYDDYLDVIKERSEELAVRQAREGRKEMFIWDRLTPEQQENLMDAGLSKEKYQNMSLEEQEQWVQCRA